MAKKRYINTKFWSDTFIVGLEPLARYLFIYLLTNEHTDICGIYELPIKVMCRETELSEKTIIGFLSLLEPKIGYYGGWVSINNFAKHQSVNPFVEKGIKRGLENIPEQIIAKISENKLNSNSLLEPIDRLAEARSYLNSNSNSNSNSKERGKNFSPPSLEEVTEYCKERTNKINPQNFIDFYTANGWMVGKNKMKDWQDCIRTWEGRDARNNPAQTKKLNPDLYE